MEIRVVYHQDVQDDIASIPHNLRLRIKKAIEDRLKAEPMMYGEALRENLSGTRKLRVGDYRVVYECAQNTVRIWGIDHRKKVYRVIGQRRRKPFQARK